MTDEEWTRERNLASGQYAQDQRLEKEKRSNQSRSLHKPTHKKKPRRNSSYQETSHKEPQSFNPVAAVIGGIITAFILLFGNPIGLVKFSFSVLFSGVVIGYIFDPVIEIIGKIIQYILSLVVVFIIGYLIIFLLSKIF